MLSYGKRLVAALLVLCLLGSGLFLLPVGATGSLGDLNGDGSLSVADVVLLRKAILAEQFFSNGDLNEDGKLTVTDVVLLRNAILTGNSPKVDGWRIEGNTTYYYRNGVAVTGWQDIDGLRYLFSEAGVLRTEVGVDVSQYQGNIDWSRVAASGVSFAMVRVGYRGYGAAGVLVTDTAFAANVAGAAAAGLDVGAYFVTQATTVAEAEEEADYVLALLAGQGITGPVAICTAQSASPDGTGRADALSRENRTTCVQAFCARIATAGYRPEIQANADWFANQLNTARLQAYDFWLLQPGETPSTSLTYQTWQYSQTGQIQGIPEAVGLNLRYLAVASNPGTGENVPENGWYTVEDQTYYYQDGVAVTGLQTIDGLRYDFSATGILLTTAGVDVSKFNGVVDWGRVAATDVSFAMIRCGIRGYGASGVLQEDSSFVTNIQGAAAAGLKVGVYFFTQATTVAEAREEADFVLGLIQDYDITYPVAIDTEWSNVNHTGRADSLDVDTRTDCILAFCQRIADAGYTPAVYASKSWFYDQLDAARLTDYDFWLAHYTEQTDFLYDYTTWQYSSTGQVDGFSSDVDLNLCYKQYG